MDVVKKVSVFVDVDNDDPKQCGKTCPFLRLDASNPEGWNIQCTLFVEVLDVEEQAPRIMVANREPKKHLKISRCPGCLKLGE